LRLKYDELLSNVTFDFHLRRYNVAALFRPGTAEVEVLLRRFSVAVGLDVEVRKSGAGLSPRL
jgi:hypothetical protein